MKINSFWSEFAFGLLAGLLMLALLILLMIAL